VTSRRQVGIPPPAASPLAAAPRNVAALEPAWLKAVLGLGDISTVSVVPIEVGNLASTVRILVTWETDAGQPRTFVAKVASEDARTSSAAERSRSYEVEVAFYRELASRLTVRTPHCYWARFDPETGRFALIMEDVPADAAYDQVSGCGPERAATAMNELGLLHAIHWADPAMAGIPWLNRYPVGTPVPLRGRLEALLPRFLDRFGNRLSADVVELILRFATRADAYDRKGQLGPRTVVHGDFRVDNLLFGQGGVCVLDWQLVHLGAALHDVSYFLGTSLRTEDRRRYEEDLARLYHRRLTAEGVDLNWEWCWREYRRHAFAALTVALASGGELTLSPKGDAMVAVIAERAGRHVLDLDSEALLGTDSP
jgi:aminoglycoside/choline kinase family phosphotransferase